MLLYLMEIWVADQRTAYISFFSGIGGWDLGAYWAGARFDEHYFSEIDSYASKIFQQRFPDAVALGDITKLKEEHFSKDRKYIFSGSFPCQDLSGAGKRAGLKGKKSGLWFEFLRLISICKPSVVLIENVAALSIRGLDVVVAGLAANGYSACWRVISAADVGALHLRQRIWIIAYPFDTALDIVPLTSFKINRHACVLTGRSTMSVEDVKYYDSYFIGSAKDNGIFFMGQSVVDKMPLGGRLTCNGDVFVVPAWERGVEVNEILENANDDIGGIDFKESSREIDRRGEQTIGGAISIESTRASFGHEDVADSDSSRWERGRASCKEESLRGIGLGCKQYSELEGAWDVKPGVQRMVDGVPWYVGSRREVPFPVTFEKQVSHNKMLSCYGNALLPQIAWIIWRRVKSLIPECYLG